MTGCRDDEIDSNTRTGVISQAALRESLQRKSKSSSCTSAKRKVAGKSNGPCEEKLNLRTEERLRSVDRLAAKQLAKSYTAKNKIKAVVSKTCNRRVNNNACGDKFPPSKSTRTSKGRPSQKGVTNGASHVTSKTRADTTTSNSQRCHTITQKQRKPSATSTGKSKSAVAKLLSVTSRLTRIDRSQLYTPRCYSTTRTLRRSKRRRPKVLLTEAAYNEPSLSHADHLRRASSEKSCRRKSEFKLMTSKPAASTTRKQNSSVRFELAVSDNAGPSLRKKRSVLRIPGSMAKLSKTRKDLKSYIKQHNEEPEECHHANNPQTKVLDRMSRELSISISEDFSKPALGTAYVPFHTTLIDLRTGVKPSTCNTYSITSQDTVNQCIQKPNNLNSEKIDNQSSEKLDSLSSKKLDSQSSKKLDNPRAKNSTKLVSKTNQTEITMAEIDFILHTAVSTKRHEMCGTIEKSAPDTQRLEVTRNVDTKRDMSKIQDKICGTTERSPSDTQRLEVTRNVDSKEEISEINSLSVREPKQDQICSTRERPTLDKQRSEVTRNVDTKEEIAEMIPIIGRGRRESEPIFNLSREEVNPPSYNQSLDLGSVDVEKDVEALLAELKLLSSPKVDPSLFNTRTDRALLPSKSCPETSHTCRERSSKESTHMSKFRSNSPANHQLKYISNGSPDWHIIPGEGNSDADQTTSVTPATCIEKTPSLLAESKTSAEEKAKHGVISTEAKLCEPCDRKTNEIQTASGKQSSELLLVAKSKSHITQVDDGGEKAGRHQILPPADFVNSEGQAITYDIRLIYNLLSKLDTMKLENRKRRQTWMKSGVSNLDGVLTPRGKLCSEYNLPNSSHKPTADTDIVNLLNDSQSIQQSQNQAADISQWEEVSRLDGGSMSVLTTEVTPQTSCAAEEEVD